MSNPQQLVQKLWNCCNILRDEGLSYGDYFEQLTYLLFLKLADEQSLPPFNKASAVPKGQNCPSLMAKDGDELENPDAGWGLPAYNKGTEGDFVARLNFDNTMLGLVNAGDSESWDTANKSKCSAAVGPVPSPGFPILNTVQCACHLHQDAGWGHPAYNRNAQTEDPSTWQSRTVS